MRRIPCCTSLSIDFSYFFPLPVPHRFLAWKKINSLIRSHTVPISKLGTTMAPSLKCLNPYRSNFVVQLLPQGDDYDEDFNANFDSEASSKVSVNYYGTASDLRRGSMPVSAAGGEINQASPPRLSLDITRGGIPISRESMSYASAKHSGIHLFEKFYNGSANLSDTSVKIGGNDDDDDDTGSYNNDDEKRKSVDESKSETLEHSRWKN